MRLRFAPYGVLILTAFAALQAACGSEVVLGGVDAGSSGSSNGGATVSGPGPGPGPGPSTSAESSTASFPDTTGSVVSATASSVVATSATSSSVGSSTSTTMVATATSTGAGGAKSCGPIGLLADPSTVMGDTTMSADDAQSSCDGSGAPDDVYLFVASQTGILDLALNSTADLGLYVRLDCADPGTEIGCADVAFANQTETLSVAVTQGQAVAIFVDGWAAGSASPYTLSAKTRVPTCGDGVVDAPAEDCDPPTPGTCSSSCHYVAEAGSCNDGIDNDGNGYTDCEDPACANDPSCPIGADCMNAPPLQTTTFGDTTGGTIQSYATCTGSGAREQMFVYSSPVAGVLSMVLQSSANLGMYARENCPDYATELFCDDREPGGVNEAYEAPVPANKSLTFFVDGYSPTDAGSYTLTTGFTPVTEVEPNDTAVNATPLTGSAVGIIYPSGEEDYYSFVLTTSATVTASASDLGSGACATGSLDTYLDIFGTDGATSLAYNDDISPANRCSKATTFIANPGTYFVRVGFFFNAGGYRLSLTIQ